MNKQRIKQLIETLTPEPGMVETGIEGVQVFRITDPVHCAPTVYEPSVVAIVGGAKEAILDGKRYDYDSSRYMCCPMSIPVDAGSPKATPDTPLLGAYIALDPRRMKELALEMETARPGLRPPAPKTAMQSLALARWDDAFADALFRLLDLSNRPTDRGVLAEGRLREFYYAVLMGEAGDTARRAFGVGNEIARAIEYLSERLDQPVTIENAAAQVGMSRAAFHRKFKQATTMSPIQYVKSMRLNSAATMIAAGTSVNVAATEVGYVSPSQFNREFKRLYGQSPRQWVRAQEIPAGLG